MLVGLTGVILHLESRFFYERTLRSLTYSAPFAAPLAYTGLGFLLIMNRMVNPESLEWAQWVLLLALGGFIGNFVFSLSDHASNGFFNPLEWVPVVASAIAVGFLTVPLTMRVSRRYIDLCAIILLLEAGVGLWGFLSHAPRVISAARRPTPSITLSTVPRPGSVAVPQSDGAWHHCTVAAAIALASGMTLVNGPLLDPHWPPAICRVCSPIFAEYRMYLNGSVFWYFSMSLR